MISILIMSGCRSLQEESELLPAAGHLDVVGHGCNLSVRVYPQGTGGLNPETGGVVSVHPFEQVVLSEEGCGKLFRMRYSLMGISPTQTGIPWDGRSHMRMMQQWQQ